METRQFLIVLCFLLFLDSSLSAENNKPASQQLSEFGKSPSYPRRIHWFRIVAEGECPADETQQMIRKEPSTSLSETVTRADENNGYQRHGSGDALLVFAVAASSLFYYYCANAQGIIIYVRQLINAYREWQRIQVFRGRARTVETCSICLEDMVPEQNLEQLYCGHDFHVGCIAPWLRTRRFCPFCRMDVV